MKRQQKGFTLVEIAIVLVIVGLLLGGILKGQEMIIQAKIKNAITDFSGVSAAYFGYLDRYRAIPGDDSGTATRWPSTPGAVAGDGSRILSGRYDQSCASVGATGTGQDESCLWWAHLRQAGFVAGSGATQPTNAFAGFIGVQQGIGTAVNTAATTAPSNALTVFSGLITCSGNLPDKVSIALDVQMDDGNPGNGTLRAVGPAAGNSPVDATTVVPATNYVETGTNTYTLCRSF